MKKPRKPAIPAEDAELFRASVSDVTPLPPLAKVQHAPLPARPIPAQRLRDDAELHDALRAAQWNVTEVARRAGLSRMTIYRRMQRAGLVPPNRQG